MNVVVVVARGLRADMLGCYGNLWISTPNLDALAADGVLFDEHFADRADTAGAWRAWQTGRYRFSDEESTDSFNLLEQLQAKGIATCLVRDARGLAVEPPGWERVVITQQGEGEEPLDQPLTAAEKALKKLAKRDGWLLWVELATVLPPWNVPADFLESYFQPEAADADEEDDEEEDDDEEEAEEVEALPEEEEVEPVEPLPDPEPGAVDPTDDEQYYRLQSTYAAAVSYLDAGIGLLLEKVLELDDDTLFLVTSDVGYPLGEHGMLGVVGSAPNEELIHLPLLMRLPNGSEAGRRVAALTQAIDLAPTLSEAFGLTAPEVQGRSLWPLMRGAAEQVRAYAVAGATGWCLRTPEWALQLPPVAGEKAQLFVKPQDRSEVNDVAQHYFEWVEYLEQLLRAFVEAARRPGPMEAPPLRAFEEAAEESRPSGGAP